MADTDAGLLGRTTEPGTLDELIVQTLRGGRVVVIEGEPGIGKTRLSQAALERATGAGLYVLAAAADELDSRRPFGVIADCLGVGLTIWSAAAEPGAWHSLEPGPEYRVVQQLVARVDHLTTDGPVLLALDDLQWADPSSLLVVHHLVRQAGAASGAANPGGSATAASRSARGALVQAARQPHHPAEPRPAGRRSCQTSASL